MPQYHFGAGSLFGRRTDTSTPTPVRFGALQNVNVDIAFTQKELFSSNQFPVAIGRGTGKITGRAAFAQLNAQALNDIFFSESSDPSTGQVLTAIAEAATVTSNVVNVSHNTTFVRDLGVTKASDGTIYARVAASPVGQQYTVNESTGAYSFNSSQNAVAVKVSYQWNDSANGKTLTITNKALGTAPQFLAVLTGSFSNKALNLVLNACMSSKLTMPTRLEDFTINDFDFAAFADSSEVIGTLSLAE